VKVDAIEGGGSVHRLKQPAGIFQRTAKEGYGIARVDDVSVLRNLLSDKLSAIIPGRPTSQDMNLVTSPGKADRLLKQHPFGPTDHALDGHIRDKQNSHECDLLRYNALKKLCLKYYRVILLADLFAQPKPGGTASYLTKFKSA
jgi:hypothetical protein